MTPQQSHSVTLVVVLMASLAGCAEENASDVRVSTKPAVSSRVDHGSLECSNSKVVFGELNDGETVSALFNIRNRGESVINIVNINSSCGCVTLAEYPDEIAGGEEFQLPVKMRASGIPGPLEKEISIQYRDSKGKVAHTILRMAGEIRPSKRIFSTTPNIGFGEVLAGESKVHVLKIARYVGPPPTRVTLISADDSCPVTASVDDSMPGQNPPKFLDVRFTLNTTNVSTGSHRWLVKLRDSSSDAITNADPIELYVTANVVDKELALVQSVFFRIPSRGSSIKVSIGRSSATYALSPVRRVTFTGCDALELDPKRTSLESMEVVFQHKLSSKETGLVQGELNVTLENGVAHLIKVSAFISP